VIVAQLGSSSRTAWLLLAAHVVAVLVFGLIWALRRDWVAAIFCVAASAGAVRMGLVLRRRSGLQASATNVVSGRASAVTPDGQLFASFARFMIGARIRPGLVLISPSSAAFVPVGAWTHLALEAVVTVFAARFRFVDLALYVSTGGDLELALRDAVRRHGGFMIDGTWTYTPSQRWLSRPDGEGLVWIERRPPASFTSRWAATELRSAAEFRAIRNRIAGVAGIVVAVLALAGVVAWRVTGDADYLIAGIAYAALVGAAVVAALVVAERRLTSTPRR
jgi:hypothetical protein